MHLIGRNLVFLMYSLISAWQKDVLTFRGLSSEVTDEDIRVYENAVSIPYGIKPHILILSCQHVFFRGFFPYFQDEFHLL